MLNKEKVTYFRNHFVTASDLFTKTYRWRNRNFYACVKYFSEIQYEKLDFGKTYENQRQKCDFKKQREKTQKSH